MTRITLLSTVAALAVAGCVMNEEVITKTEADLRSDETVAPAAPTETAGTVDPANTLNGTYNLRSADCGKDDTVGALKIEGSRFMFSQSSCVAASTEIRGDAAEVKLTCEGPAEPFGRLVKLRLSPGKLQMEEDGANVSYYRCPTPDAVAVTPSVTVSTPEGTVTTPAKVEAVAS